MIAACFWVEPAELLNIGIHLDERTIIEIGYQYPVELVHGCYYEYLARFSYDVTEIVYASPPYVVAARMVP